jgi:uncharacterized protein YkwD
MADVTAPSLSGRSPRHGLFRSLLAATLSLSLWSVSFGPFISPAQAQTTQSVSGPHEFTRPAPAPNSPLTDEPAVPDDLGPAFGPAPLPDDPDESFQPTPYITADPVLDEGDPANPDPLPLIVLPSLAATLRWTPPQDTTQVQMQVIPSGNDGPGLNLIIGDPQAVASKQYALTPPQVGQGNYLLLPGMTYSWRVRFSNKPTFAGEDDSSWGAWTPGDPFRTPAPSIKGLQVVAPTEGAKMPSSGPVTLQWSHNDSSLFYYEVQVSGDRRFDTNPASATSFVWWNLIHGGQSSPINSWQTPPLTEGTTYFWRVRPRVQGDGAAVSWSPTWSFTTPGNAVVPLHAIYDGMENDMLALVNQERATVGLPALVMDDEIRSVARHHSADMVDRAYFAHNTPEGIDPFARMRSGGVTFGYGGENIARSSSVAQAHAALMNSAGHRANILFSNYHRIGIGIEWMSNGQFMFTQDFAD